MYRCASWEKRAEFVTKYFTKGQEALVLGSLNVRSYEDKDGIKRTVFEVLVSQVEFCGKKHAAYDKDGNERKPIFQEVEDDGGEIPFERG